jgi:hypothetical protein
MLRGGQIDGDSIVGLLLQRWQIVVVGIRLVSGCTAASSAVGFLLGGRQLGLEPPAPQRRRRGVNEHRQGHGVGVRARPRCGANEHEPRVHDCRARAGEHVWAGLHAIAAAVAVTLFE